MCQFVGVLALLLSESILLPMNVTRYAVLLQQVSNELRQIDARFGTLH